MLERPTGRALPRWRSYVLPVALLLLHTIAYVGLAHTNLRTGTLTHGTLPQTLKWYGLAYVAYLATIWWAESQRRFPAGVVWAGAVLFQVLLLSTAPTLSDDVYRYLWDGHVANSGVSPYAYPIDAPELDGLDIPVRGLANHTWMASPYLPAAQALFRSVTRFFPPTPLSMQITMVVCTMLTGIVIVGLLSMASLPRYRVLLYLWNPLVILETAHGAHLDAYMVLLMLVGVWFALYEPAAGDRMLSRLVGRTGTWLLSPLFLAFATLTKVIPVLLAPVLVWRWRWTGLAVYSAAIVALVAPAGFRAGWGLTEPLDGRGLFGAIRIYNDRWDYNSGLFHWLQMPLLRFGSPAETADMWAKRITAGILVAVVLAVMLAARRYSADRRALLRLMPAPLMALVLLTTTVNPWYLLPVLAFVLFWAPNADEPAGYWLIVAPWIYLTGAIILSYLTYLDPENLREYEWVRLIEWLPTLALLAAAGGWLWYRRRRSA